MIALVTDHLLLSAILQALTCHGTARPGAGLEAPRLNRGTPDLCPAHIPAHGTAPASSAPARAGRWIASNAPGSVTCWPFIVAPGAYHLHAATSARRCCAGSARTGSAIPRTRRLPMTRDAVTGPCGARQRRCGRLGFCRGGNGLSGTDGQSGRLATPTRFPWMRRCLPAADRLSVKSAYAGLGMRHLDRHHQRHQPMHRPHAPNWPR